MQSTLQSRLTDMLSTALGVSDATDELSLAMADRSALGARLVKTLAGERLIAPADLYRVIPRRTWLRRKGAGALTPAEFDGLFRLVRLQLLAELVFGDVERARDWLHTAKKRLGGASPLDFASDMLGYEAVENWLYEIDGGYFG
jgi:putative toxin-antitoxin system antitoxin component (TIGR02293 family)